MIYDISQELTNCIVFPGDNSPKRIQVKNMDDGSLYNLSNLEMCVHNGTHVDSPYHFINNGKTIEKIPLEYFVGACYVCEYKGDITASLAEEIMTNAMIAKADKRILIKGDITVTLEAAKVFSSYGIYLIGNESQTVGPLNAPMAVHLELLGHNVVLLEGIRLDDVTPGVYFLSAVPINIKGSDGAPVRAYLIKQ